MKRIRCSAKIAGINHMAWLLEITDRDGNDLYPEIKRRAAQDCPKGTTTWCALKS